MIHAYSHIIWTDTQCNTSASNQFCNPFSTWQQAKWNTLLPPSGAKYIIWFVHPWPLHIYSTGPLLVTVGYYCPRDCILNVTWHWNKWKPAVFLLASSSPERWGVIHFSKMRLEQGEHPERIWEISCEDSKNADLEQGCFPFLSSMYQETPSIPTHMFDLCLFITPEL